MIKNSTEYQIYGNGIFIVANVGAGENLTLFKDPVFGFDGLRVEHLRLNGVEQPQATHARVILQRRQLALQLL